jgi:hypothetical protein
MSHIHWVARQNKLETPKEKDEVNEREVHEYDVRTRHPDARDGSPTDTQADMENRNPRQDTADHRLNL